MENQWIEYYSITNKGKSYTSEVEILAMQKFVPRASVFTWEILISITDRGLGCIWLVWVLRIQT